MKDWMDSMLASGSEDDEEGDHEDGSSRQRSMSPDGAASEAPSAAPSMATDLALTPESLTQRFPTLFNLPQEYSPKVLITTSINSTLHGEARLLTTLFPNSHFIKRTAHFHAYKYSIREIAGFAAARDFTHLVILNQHLHKKEPSGLDIVFLPVGPMFHFSISNWIPGAKLPRTWQPHKPLPRADPEWLSHTVGVAGGTSVQVSFPVTPGNPRPTGRHVTQPA